MWSIDSTLGFGPSQEVNERPYLKCRMPTPRWVPDPSQEVNEHPYLKRGASTPRWVSVLVKRSMSVLISNAECLLHIGFLILVRKSMSIHISNVERRLHVRF